MPGIPFHLMHRTVQYAECPQIRADYAKYKEKFSIVEGLQISIANIDYMINKRKQDYMYTEADVGYLEEGSVDPGLVDEKQNVQDVAGDAPSTAALGMRRKAMTLIKNPLSLDDFFGRPVEIDNFNIALSTDIDKTYDIWSLLLNVPSIRAKLRNVGFIRFDIGFRVTVSASPFHLGFLQFSYVPFAKLLDVTVHYDAVAALRPNYLKYLSQTRGVQYIDVKDNKPVDKKIPYVNFQPMLRLFNNSASALAAGSNYDDTTNLGRVYLKTLNQIKCVTAAPSQVSVYIYAWMENVALGCPTATQIAITTEADHGEVYDTVPNSPPVYQGDPLNHDDYKTPPPVYFEIRPPDAVSDDEVGYVVLHPPGQDMRGADFVIGIIAPVAIKWPPSVRVLYVDVDTSGSMLLFCKGNLNPFETTLRNVGTDMGRAADIVLGDIVTTNMQTQADSDERVRGPVEKISSSVAAAADMLSSIPVIGAYAKASSIFLNGVSQIAALFGWSSPVMFLKPGRIKNEPFQNGCNVVGYDTGKKISVDPKQELTIDPRIGHTDMDELSIPYLCSVESLLDQFTWHNSDAPMVAIWQCAVSPRIVVEVNNAGTSDIQPSMLAYVSTLFEYWHGSISFRFQVVCSQYARGKFAIIYEPNISQNVLISGVAEMNKQYLVIVDLQQTQTVDICVDWNYSRPWATVMGDADAQSSVGSQFASPVNKIDSANGYISFVPLTRLQNPDDSDVYVNAYIWSDDMQFNFTNDRRFTGSKMFTQADSEGVTCFELAPAHTNFTHLHDEYFGEAIVSFRALLKRFHTSEEATIGASGSSLRLINWGNSIYPSLGPTVSAAQSRFILFNYVRRMFLAFRGGMKKRLQVTGTSEACMLAHAKVSLQNPQLTGIGRTLTYTTAGDIFVPCLYRGTVSFIPSTNAGIEFSLPMYTNNSFYLAQTSDPCVNSDTNFCGTNLSAYSMVLNQNITSANATSVTEESAIDEDMTFIYRLPAAPYTATTV